MTINTQDRAGNPIPLKTQLSSASEHVGSTAITDAGGNLQAQVAALHTTDNNAPGSVNELAVGSYAQLLNAAGNFDRAREAGADPMPLRGLPPAVAMVGTRYTATSTTSVSSTTASATISVAATAGFKVGGWCNLEPGTTNYESALITAVVTNSSLTISFPSGGALFTHTANYTIETFDASLAREAPGRQGALAVSSDGTKPTYRAGQVAQTLYSTAAAVIVEVVGSATMTIRVKKITLWAQAGTKFYGELTLLRCTAASAGTAVVAAIGKHDKNDAAATAVINGYTAAATAGAGNAVIGAKVLPTVAPAAGVQIQVAQWDFSQNQDKAMILRGTGDVIEVFNNTTGLGTATYGFEVEWEEDNS